MKSMTVLLLCFATLFVAEVNAQDSAKGRAEIANQRILAEAERRRQEELAAEQAANEAEAQEATAPPPSPAAEVVTPTPADVPESDATVTSSGPARSRADLNVVLQQIRTLGELRDAGYVTADEFERIKTRILDGAL